MGKGKKQNRWGCFTQLSVLIDGGASHNFIDSDTLLQRRHIPSLYRSSEFEGFTYPTTTSLMQWKPYTYNVGFRGSSTMPCDRYIPGMKLALGRHDLAQYFYVMDLLDTNIILGVQWLSMLGPFTTNYKTMEMYFMEESGKTVVLRGMTGNTPRVVTTKRMEAIFRREDIVYAIECKISV
jgi:hypothetical protein